MFANISRVAATTTVALTALVTVSDPAAASGRYRMVDLGFAGEARAMNSHGQVVGEGSVGAGGGTHGFLWSAGRVTDLGVLEHSQWEYGRATAVNDHSLVAGFSVVRGDPEQSGQHAFVWQRGVLTDIDPDGLDSMATAVNNAGQVVGARYTADGPRAFRWQAGVMTDLGTGAARDINDRGQVVGVNRPGGVGATMWFQGREYDLGAPPGLDDWRPIAINNQGWIVGNGGVLPEHAYLWRAGTFLDLGTLGGPAASVIDINDRGQILGMSDVTPDTAHPFLWQDGRMVDLTTRGVSGFVSLDALGPQGQLVGAVGDPFDQHAGFYR